MLGKCQRSTAVGSTWGQVPWGQIYFPGWWLPEHFREILHLANHRAQAPFTQIPSVPLWTPTCCCSHLSATATVLFKKKKTPTTTGPHAETWKDTHGTTVITKCCSLDSTFRRPFKNAVSFLSHQRHGVSPRCSSCVLLFSTASTPDASFGCVFFTFHDIDQRAHVAFLDDAAVFSVLHRIHAVHDLLDLRQLQVLHEVIVQDGLLDQILGPAGQVERKSLLYGRRSELILHSEPLKRLISRRVGVLHGCFCLQQLDEWG